MFSSLLLSYGALLMVPFLVVVALVNLWDNSMERYYKEIVRSSLTEGRMAFEKRLEVLRAGAFSLVYDSELNWVSYLDGLRPGDTSVVTLVNCNEKIGEAFADTATYYSYCVVLNNGFVFRKSGMCIGQDFFFENYRRYENMTFEEWQQRSFDGASGQLFAMQEIQTESNTEKALTYSYPIRSGVAQKGKAKAVVQFLLPEQEIKEMFSVLLDMQGVVYMFDGDGNMLAEISEGYDGEGLPPENLPEAGAYDFCRLNDSERLIVRQDSNDGTITFAVALPAEIAMMNMKQTRLVAWIVLAVGVLFEVLLGIRFAMKYSVPIRNVVENMQRMFAAAENGARPESSENVISEYEFLERGVDALMSTNRSMQHILSEKNARERVNFLTLLFNGDFRSSQQVEEEGRHVGVELKASCYYCMVLYMKNQLEELIRYLEESHYSFVTASYMVDEQRLALLIAGADENPEEDVYHRERLLQGLAEKKLYQAYAGVGRTYREKSDIALSFRQACYCAEKAAREQMTERVEYSRALLDLNMPWYPSDVEEKLTNAARCGKTEDVRALFARIRQENMEKVHLSHTIRRVLTSNITFTLLAMYDSIAENEKVTETIERIEKADKLEDALLLLEEQFTALSNRIGASRNKKTEEYYRRLRDYIERNYQDEQFGVAVAAEEFGLSESYFSTFFKEIMGKAFSGYLENMRLEKSKELISEGRYDLEQISRMVGYNNSGTFRRAFKRAYGVAPSAWKS